jgi:hypothetical protein
MLVMAIFVVGLVIAGALLWKSLEYAQPARVREIRITGVDYHHSQGKRFWDNYEPKRDLVLVISGNKVLGEITPDNVIGTSLQERFVQYKKGDEIKTLAIEGFLGPPNCIRVNNKLVINQF